MPVTLVQMKEVLSLLKERHSFFENQMSLYHNSDQHKCYKKNLAHYSKQIDKLNQKIANYRP